MGPPSPAPGDTCDRWDGAALSLGWGLMGPTWLPGAASPAAAPAALPFSLRSKFNNFTEGMSSAEPAEAFLGINPASSAARRSHGCWPRPAAAEGRQNAPLCASAPRGAGQGLPHPLNPTQPTPGDLLIRAEGKIARGS